LKPQSDENNGPVTSRRRRGKAAYLSGVAAEDIVAKAYRLLGARLLESRWRGQAGEIDMILRHDHEIVFCEVKKARSFDAAIARLRPDQMQRIHVAASEYLAQVPTGQLTEVRFDLAVVDETGQAKIFQNAFGHF
jgi:putative endonuclease